MSKTGSKTVGTSAVRLSDDVYYNTGGIRLKASNDNGAGLVYVGHASDITAGTADGYDGYELRAGDTMTIPRSRARTLRDVWLIADTADMKVSYLVEGNEVG